MQTYFTSSHFMNETQQLLKAFEKNRQQQNTLIQVQVISTQGSSYRKPGARMLMNELGERIGIINGGCLDGEITREIQKTLFYQKPRILEYDTRKEDSADWLQHGGCNGVVELWFCPSRPSDDYGALGLWAEAQKKRTPGVLFSNLETGQCVWFPKHQEPKLPLQGEVSPQVLIQLKEKAFQLNNTPKRKPAKLDLPELKETWFCEPVRLAHKIVIFGAGADSVPLMNQAELTGFQVEVWDKRSQLVQRLKKQNFESVFLHQSQSIEAICQGADAVVVKTHSFEMDASYLELLQAQELSYIGLLGPEERCQEIYKYKEIDSTGIRDKLYSPIGLDLGGDTPEIIALSIVAEIQKVLSGHQGLSLKYKKSGIHCLD